VINTPGAIGYWPFTTTSGPNSVVGGFTGTFSGNAALGASGSGPTLASDPGNRRLALDGTTNTFVNTNLVGGTSSGGSIVGWFNIALLPSSAGRPFYIAGQSQAGNDFDVEIEADNFIRFYTTNGGALASASALTAADIGQWHFLAATFTANGTRSLYLDALPPVTGAAGGHSTAMGTFTMGESVVFGGRQFNGGLDEIAIFNRELTATEVANIYASRLVVPEPSSFWLVTAAITGWCTRRRAGALRQR
jgi:hypothetical protein